MRCRSALAAALMLVAVATAQEFDFGWKPKVGDVAAYSLRMEFTLFGDVAVYTAKVHDKVIEASADRVVVDTSQTDYKVTLFGDEATVSDANLPKAQTVFTLLGDVVEVRGDLTSDVAYRMANLTAVRRPDKPIKVGDSWVREVKGDPKTGALAAKATYKADAVEKLKDVEAVVASFEYAETEGSDPALSVGKVWFTKDGKVLKSEATWTSAPIPGAPSPVNGSVVLERIDAGL